MYVVHFLENKNTLLTQLRSHIPTIGEELTIKGRKAKVTSVENIDEKNIHVQLTIAIINKSKSTVDPSKKKKR
ncbi:hypothetical protein [Bacillus niameyensis]|uniref:hypothetical protein n=1 Tax=Bacillus niameyensis TaxID=1522308 RepID=UPI000782A693|nr:hypothetical protein [Bacillus niameyensis]